MLILTRKRQQQLTIDIAATVSMWQYLQYDNGGDVFTYKQTLEAVEAAVESFRPQRRWWQFWRPQLKKCVEIPCPGFTDVYLEVEKPKPYTTYEAV